MPQTPQVIKGTVSLPYFEPEDQKISPRAWLQLVELARMSAGTEGEGADKKYIWSDEQMIMNCILLFRSSASRWAEILLEKNAPELKKWDDFKKIFKKRFVKSLTLTEKIALTDLHQKHSETVSQFLDRCTNNLNLFFETEWESLTVGETTADLPWGAPNTRITEDHVKISQNYYRQAINLQVRLLFASGLRPDIKKQTLMQPGETLEEILEVAKRVESSLKETKKEVNVTNIDEVSNLEDLEAAAVNRKPPFKPNPNRGPNVGNTNAGGKCFYCGKGGHFKRDCMTMRNDRAKGIFRTNLTAPLSKRRQASSTDITDEDVEAATAAVETNVNSAQIDLMEMLNPYSA